VVTFKSSAPINLYRAPGDIVPVTKNMNSYRLGTKMYLQFKSITFLFCLAVTALIVIWPQKLIKLSRQAIRDKRAMRMLTISIVLFLVMWTVPVTIGV
jgi:hypothetical protein